MKHSFKFVNKSIMSRKWNLLEYSKTMELIGVLKDHGTYPNPKSLALTINPNQYYMYPMVKLCI